MLGLGKVKLGISMKVNFGLSMKGYGCFEKVLMKVPPYPLCAEKDCYFIDFIVFFFFFSSYPLNLWVFLWAFLLLLLLFA